MIVYVVLGPDRGQQMENKVVLQKYLATAEALH